jgi:hypothetical protein
MTRNAVSPEGLVNRSFYIVTPGRTRATEAVGTVLGRCSALHAAVALCHSMWDDLMEGTERSEELVIVESHAALGEGELVPRVAAVRIFERDGTRC